LQEGILTVVVSLGAYFFVYNYPDTARFLSAKERALIHQRLKDDNDATRNESFTWGNVMKALSDPKVWLYGAAFHTLSLPLYTLSLFLVCKPPLVNPEGFGLIMFSRLSSRSLATPLPKPS